MADLVNIRELKANKEQNATLWTPLDCLKALVRDLECGEVAPVDGIYIAMVRKDANGQAQSFPFYTGGCTTLESRGILQQHLFDMCDHFRNGKR